MRDGYVLGFPATPADEPAVAPALVADTTPLGMPLTIWTPMETGIGSHLLGHNFGSLFDGATLEAVRNYSAGDRRAPLPVAEGSYEDPANAAYVTGMLLKMQSYCLHEVAETTAT